MKGIVVSVAFLCLGALYCSQEGAILSEPEEPAVRLTRLRPCEPNTECYVPVSTWLADLFHPQKGSLDRLKIEIEQGKISFTHICATMNCCLDGVSLAPEWNGSFPRVIDTEHTSRPCPCECDYTIDGKITGVLVFDQYTIEVRNIAAPWRILCSARVSAN